MTAGRTMARLGEEAVLGGLRCAWRTAMEFLRKHWKGKDDVPEPHEVDPPLNRQGIPCSEDCDRCPFFYECEDFCCRDDCRNCAHRHHCRDWDDDPEDDDDDGPGESGPTRGPLERETCACI